MYQLIQAFLKKQSYIAYHLPYLINKPDSEQIVHFKRDARKMILIAENNAINKLNN